MIKRLLLSTLMVSTVAIAIGFQITDATAQSRTQGQELERRQNSRTDSWAAQQKQQAREQAESRATNRGVGQEKQIQNRERAIDRQAAQRRQDDAAARSRLPKEKMDKPYVEKKPQSNQKPNKR